MANVQPVGLTRSSILFPISDLLGEVGAPVERLLGRSGLRRWVLDDPETLVPTSGIARFINESARVEGIGNLGLLAGQKARIESLGVFGRLIRRAPTLGQALETLAALHPSFSSNGRIWLSMRDDEVEVCQAFVKRFDDEWQQASHYILMLLLGVVRLAAGEAWQPTRVRLQTGEVAAVRDFAPFSRTRIDFRQGATSFVVPRAFMALPLRAPVDVPEVPEELVETWRRSAPADDFVASVTQVMETLSWEGYPGIQHTAEAVGLSIRTLQRHLAAAGFTHEALVAHLRFATAATLLEETDAKILDVALDLGYSDHAHFTRAFRRWAGCSPQEYRNRHRRAPQIAG
jgi:AraC-like DNA-binding protein